MRFFVRTTGDREVDLDFTMVLLAGYTGRDQDAVRAHVDELAAHGIAAPGTIPAVYPVPPTRLTTSRRIAVHGERTAGEAEFLLVRHEGRVLVGVGSDHTDRELEEHSIVKSKQTCDKPVNEVLWELDELADHWDELTLRGEVYGDAGWETYQDGSVASMLTPKDILAVVGERVEGVADAAVFSGTLPLIGGEFRYGPRFRATLADPVLDRQLVCEYEVQELPETGS